MINWLFDYFAFSIRSFVFVFFSAAGKTMETLIIKGDDNRTDQCRRSVLLMEKITLHIQCQMKSVNYKIFQ